MATATLVNLPTELLDSIIDWLIQAEGGCRSEYLDDKVIHALLPLRLVHPKLLPILDARIYEWMEIVVGGLCDSRLFQLCRGGISQNVKHISFRLATVIWSTRAPTRQDVFDEQLEAMSVEVSLGYLDDPGDNFIRPVLDPLPRLTSLSLQGHSWLVYLQPISILAPHLASIALLEDALSDLGHDYSQSVPEEHEDLLNSWQTPLKSFSTLRVDEYHLRALHTFFRIAQPQFSKLIIKHVIEEEIDFDISPLMQQLAAPRLLEKLRSLKYESTICYEPDGRDKMEFVPLWDDLRYAWRGKGMVGDFTFLDPLDRMSGRKVEYIT